jgi:hypothetical protein
VQQALDALRDLSAGLYPPTLADRGLAAAIELHALRHGLDVRVDVHGEGPPAPTDVQAAAFFCVASIIDDVGRTGRCGIELHLVDRGLAVVVRSDGQPSADTAELVADRVAALGGHVGTGTALRIEFPASDDAAATDDAPWRPLVHGGGR